MRYESTADALTALTTGDEIAVDAHLFSGIAVVMRVERHFDEFVVSLDDGESIRRIPFANTVELASRLADAKTSLHEEGYDDACHRLVIRFTQAVAISDTRRTELNARLCPNCSAEWRENNYSHIIVSTVDGEALGLQCGCCLHTFRRTP